MAVHAVKKRNGGLGVILIYKDFLRSAVATVTVSGYAYAAKGARYDYGKFTIDDGKTITEEPIDNLGRTFTVELPRYGVTAIVIPKEQ